ncbi:MAG TPA: serine/threonine-protein kinase [Bryobacteraceae bacterium]|nr:serine/threonine-protein kinase [Bryobacteraceae bacterium]
MNAEIERLFEAALEIPPEQRAWFLSRQCADDEVRREVELLLEHDRGAETFLAHAVAGEAASVVQSLSFSAGQRLGPYRILSVIGRGGMGLVYLAERADGKFEQRVAIKVVQAGLGGPLAGRLEQECRILATLDHPNIARLLDAGATQDGLPYFIMEYIAGQPIDRFCDDRKLSVRERIRLMLPVCEAVQLAHQSLVVHRDLKPDNILVTAEGIPKLLDFGIAKVLSEAPAASPQTVTRVLTPEYGSPEQVRGELVSTGTDIYGLGGVLYKLLTGMAPHQIEDKSPVDALRAICEEDIRRPSSLRPELAGDLDRILQMALRKEPQRRYGSADQFAADLRRWLANKPVLASPDTVWYRSGKFLKRHWVGVAAAVIVLTALVTGAAVALWQARRAERRFADVRHLAHVFLFDFEESVHHLRGATKARQLLVKTALEYLASLSKEAAGDAALTRELADAYEKVGDIQGEPGAGNVGNTEGAVQSYRQAVSLRQSLHDAESVDPAIRMAMAAGLVKLANVQARTRDLEGAVSNCRRALSLAEKTLKARSSLPPAMAVLAQAHSVMSLLLLKKNDIRGSIDEAGRSLALRELLAAAAPRDRSAQLALADADRAIGKLTGQMGTSNGAAIAYYSKAREIFERLSREDPSDGESERGLMKALSELGFSMLEPGSSKADALANMRRAYTMADRKVRADPADAEDVTNLFAICVRLGGSLEGRRTRAERYRILGRAVQAAGDLVQRDPGNEDDRLLLGSAHDHIAGFLEDDGNLGDAVHHRQVAADIYRDLAAADPSESRIRLTQVWSCLRFGDLLARQRDWAGARRSYGLGREVAEKMAPANPAFAKPLAAIQRADLHAAQVLGNRR